MRSDYTGNCLHWNPMTSRPVTCLGFFAWSRRGRAMRCHCSSHPRRHAQPTGTFITTLDWLTRTCQTVHLQLGTLCERRSYFQTTSTQLLHSRTCKDLMANLTLPWGLTEPASPWHRTI